MPGTLGQPFWAADELPLGVFGFMECLTPIAKPFE
jgi:hypothetical protein